MASSDFLSTGSRKSDVIAFKKFFEGFYPSVCIFAGKYLNDADAAQDIAQEAFVEYWKIKEKFTDVRAVKGFIYTVTRNKCLNQLAVRKIREHIPKDEILTDDRFYEFILEEETYCIVHNAIDKLAPQCRKIALLSLDQLKNSEIADQMKISVNTVKTLKKIAYKELRLQLKNYLFNFLFL